MRLEYNIKMLIEFPEKCNLPSGAMMQELFNEFVAQKGLLEEFKESIIERYNPTGNKGHRWTEERKEEYKKKFNRSNLKKKVKLL